MDSITIPEKPRSKPNVTSGTHQNLFLTCELIVLFCSLAAQKVATLKIIKDVCYNKQKLPPTQDLKKQGVSLFFRTIKAKSGSLCHSAIVIIETNVIVLPCSTREVAFVYGHFINHNRKYFCGDVVKFARFIIDRYAKDLLAIGIAKPPKNVIDL